MKTGLNKVIARQPERLLLASVKIGNFNQIVIIKDFTGKRS